MVDALEALHQAIASIPPAIELRLPESLACDSEAQRSVCECPVAKEPCISSDAISTMNGLLEAIRAAIASMPPSIEMKLPDRWPLLQMEPQSVPIRVENKAWKPIEYRIIACGGEPHRMQERFNELAGQGYELICEGNGYFYFRIHPDFPVSSGDIQTGDKLTA